MGIKAIDVSSWQHPNGAGINWGQVKADGYDGVWVKCSQGTNYKNPFYDGDVAAALEAGLVVGAYHFAEPGNNSAESEAEWALACAGSHPLALGLALDFEALGTLPAHEAGNWCPAFLGAIAAHHTLAPFYTDQSILAQAVGAPWGYPLWIADPSGTYEGVWWAKQTGNAPVNGIVGGVDIDEVPNVRAVNPAPPGGGGAGSTPPPPPQSPTGEPTGTAPPTAGGSLDVNVPELSEHNPGPSVASPAVRALQVLLVDKWGADLTPAGIDGRFGAKTADAVRWVQGEGQGRAGPVDGIVGPETWSYLVNGG